MEEHLVFTMEYYIFLYIYCFYSSVSLIVDTQPSFFYLKYTAVNIHVILSSWNFCEQGFICDA